MKEIKEKDREEAKVIEWLQMRSRMRWDVCDNAVWFERQIKFIAFTIADLFVACFGQFHLIGNAIVSNSNVSGEQKSLNLSVGSWFLKSAWNNFDQIECFHFDLFPSHWLDIFDSFSSSPYGSQTSYVCYFFLKTNLLSRSNL